MATAEVGKVGVAIDTLADMELMFEGIPADSVKRIGTLGNSIGPDRAGAVRGARREAGHRPGTATPSICRTIRSRNTSRAARRSCRRRRRRSSPTDCVAWCVEHAPNWSPMTVCVNHINAGGAGSSMGTAIALANARHYLDLAAGAAATAIDQVAPLLHMFPDERHDFFVSIANLRALRRIWARHDEGDATARRRPAAMACQHHRLRPRPGGAGGAAQQHPAHRLRHARLCAGRRVLRLSRRLRRGGVDAEREFRARRAAHAADHRQRARLHRHHRSARRLLLRRDADRAGRAADPRRHGADRAGRRCARRHRDRLRPPGDDRGRGAAPARDRQRRAAVGHREHVAAEAERAEHRVPRRRQGDRAPARAARAGEGRPRPGARARRRSPRSTAPPPRTATWCRACSRRCAPTPPSARSSTSGAGASAASCRRRTSDDCGDVDAPRSAARSAC